MKRCSWMLALSLSVPVLAQDAKPAAVEPGFSLTVYSTADPATFEYCYLEVAGLSKGDTALMAGVSLPEANIGTQGVTATFTGAAR